MIGRGGWPLTVFLTPDGRPFHGGTYFPPVDRHGLPGFPRVLDAVVARVPRAAGRRGQGGRAARRRRRSAPRRPRRADGGARSRRCRGAPRRRSCVTSTRCTAASAARPSSRTPGPSSSSSGSGVRPAAPGPSRRGRAHLRGAWPTAASTTSSAAASTATRSTRAGSCRTSRRCSTTTPSCRGSTSSCSRRPATPAHRRVVEETLDYLLREMRTPTGGFYSATDADSEGEEGKFFVWTPAEVAAVVDPADVDLVCRYWDITDEGNFEGKNIAHVTLTVDQVAKLFRPLARGRRERPSRRARARLFAARSRRVPPRRDDKILTSWNALAHRHAGGGRTGARRAALRRRPRSRRPTSSGSRCGATAGCCTAGPRDGRSRTRSSTTTRSWRRRSSTCTRRPATAVISPARASSSTRSTTRFHDDAGGGYFFTPHDGEALIVRTKSGADGSIPSGNGGGGRRAAAAACAHGRGALPRRVPRRSCASTRRAAAENPFGYTTWLEALERWSEGATEVVIVGARTTPRHEGALGRRRERVDPASHPGPRRARATADVPAVARDRPAVGGRATAYVCRNFACSRPVHTPEELGRAARRRVPAASATASVAAELRGGRRSRWAASPSCRSALERTRRCISSRSSRGSVRCRLVARCTNAFMARTESGAFCTIWCASDSTALSSSSAGTTRFTRPSVQARLGRHRLAGEQQLVRLGGADGVDELPGERHRDGEPDARERHREARRVGGDADVAMQRQLAAAGDGVALDGGDGRLRDRPRGPRAPSRARPGRPRPPRAAPPSRAGRARRRTPARWRAR